MEVQIYISNNLKFLRGHFHLTHREIAVLSGVSKASLTLYEKGVIVPSFFRLNRLAKVFGITPSDLMYEDMADQALPNSLGNIFRDSTVGAIQENKKHTSDERLLEIFSLWAELIEMYNMNIIPIKSLPTTIENVITIIRMQNDILKKLITLIQEIQDDKK